MTECQQFFHLDHNLAQLLLVLLLYFFAKAKKLFLRAFRQSAPEESITLNLLKKENRMEGKE